MMTYRRRYASHRARHDAELLIIGVMIGIVLTIIVMLIFFGEAR